MESAIDIICKVLVSPGMTADKADDLVGRFLQDETFQYVEYISSHLNELIQDTNTSKLFS